MSVQLIIYPQSYEGVYTNISTPVYTQYIADMNLNNGSFWTTYNSHGNLMNPFYSASMNILFSTNWSTFYTGTEGTYWNGTAAPVFTSNQITFKSGTHATKYSWGGIVCQVGGVVAGLNYDIEVQVSSVTGTDNAMYVGSGIGSYTGYLGQTVNTIPQVTLMSAGTTYTSGTYTATFQATHNFHIIPLQYGSKAGTDLVITSVSLKENISSVPTTDEFIDGQVICDLYSDESIPLTLSIDEFKNVAEKKQSFSKAFNLPATKRNNKIFCSLFDVTKSVYEDAYSFNPYKKTKAILKEDGYTIFEGFLRLIDIEDGIEETSYNVNLYSDVISLKDTLGSKTLLDLNDGFRELEHEYHKTNIKQSWEGELDLSMSLSTDSFAYTASLGVDKTDVLKYPFCNWHGNIALDSNSVYVDLDRLEDAFRPWIRCKYLVDRIIHEAGFTYTSTFLNSSDFTRLFMDFNWGSDNAPVNTSGTTSPLLEHTNTDGSFQISTTSTYTNLRLDCNGTTPDIKFWDKANDRFISDENGIVVNFNCHWRFKVDGATSRTVDRQIKLTRAAGGIEYYKQSSPSWSSSTSQPRWYFNWDSPVLQSGDIIEFQLKVSTHSYPSTVVWQRGNPSGFGYSHMIVNRSQKNITSSAILNTLRGKIKQWDFIKGLVDMFNLMIMIDKDNPTNLKIEPYKDIFVDNSDIETLDWTSKVDVSKINLKPIDLKRELKLKYVDEPKDYGLKQYHDSTGSNFGEAVVTAHSFTLLDGETKIEAKPFAPTLCKPLFDNYTDVLTVPIMYEVKEDGTSVGLKNKPRILYDVSHTTQTALGGGHVIYFPNQFGLSSEFQGNFGQFCHLTEVPTTATTKDYNFGASQLISSMGNTPVDNLFNLYWAPYYDELYHSDTKTVTLQVYLTPADLSNFNFYDKIRIKNREYRVNKIDYKPKELSKVEFILIG